MVTFMRKTSQNYKVKAEAVEALEGLGYYAPDPIEIEPGEGVTLVGCAETATGEVVFFTIKRGAEGWLLGGTETVKA